MTNQDLTLDQLLESLYDRVLEPQEVKEQILILFGKNQKIKSCDHEWENESFDHFGFVSEQRCKKCDEIRFV